jgi:hypothetical protein
VPITPKTHVASLRIAVVCVVCRRSKEQVVGIDAWRDVALVKHAESWRDLASKEHPGNPVGLLCPAPEPEQAVAERLLRPRPEPALAIQYGNALEEQRLLDFRCLPARGADR